MDQYIEQLKPLFTQVADKIGQGAEFGWEVVYRQQIAYSIVAIFVALFSLILLYLYIKDIKEEKEKEKEEEFDEDTWSFIVLLGMLILTPTIWASIYAILHLINPQYYALQFFIKLVQ